MKINNVLFKVVSALFLFVSGYGNVMGQLFYPTSVKSTFFNNAENFLVEGGINNYAIDCSVNYRIKRFALSVQYDYNNENLDINPLNFYSIEVQGIESHRIQSKAKSTKYGEFKISYIPKLEKRKLEIGIGMGRNWILNKNRYFAQIGLGNENKFIDAGVTIRGSYVERLFGFDILGLPWTSSP